MATYYACESPTWDKKVDTGLGVPKVEAEMLRKSLDGRFRGVVGRVSWGVGNALLAAGDDNGGGPTLCSLLNYRKEGVNAMEYPKEVRLEDLCSAQSTYRCQWWTHQRQGWHSSASCFFSSGFSFPSWAPV